jgi:hypothetical protein
VSAVPDAINGAIVVLADEETSDETSTRSPLSTSGLDVFLYTSALPLETATPHPCLTPPHWEGHSPDSPPEGDVHDPHVGVNLEVSHEWRVLHAD